MALRNYAFVLLGIALIWSATSIDIPKHKVGRHGCSFHKSFQYLFRYRTDLQQQLREFLRDYATSTTEHQLTAEIRKLWTRNARLVARIEEREKTIEELRQGRFQQTLRAIYGPSLAVSLIMCGFVALAIQLFFWIAAAVRRSHLKRAKMTC